MILTFFRQLFELGLTATGAFLFLSLIAAKEVGYRLARRPVAGRTEPGSNTSGISTLTAGMVGLLAFTLGLSINFAQNRFEMRRILVLSEANAIGTSWLRTKLIDGDEGPVIAAKIEDYARVRLAFTIAGSDTEITPIIERGNILQNEIWRNMEAVARRSPNTLTSALVSALNEMFDNATSQQFAYLSRVPVDILLSLYFGALLAIGAVGYQSGLAGSRQLILSSLLLMMWSGGMILIVDLNHPRVGHVRVDPEPLVWVIQSFGPRSK